MAIQASVPVPGEESRAISVSWAMVAIAMASVIRLALILVPSHGYDSFAYKHWTWRLVHQPLNRFYVDDGQAFPDHLPGDLWLFKLLGAATRFFQPDIDFYGSAYGALISMLAMSFDGLLALSLVALGRAIGRQREGLLAGTMYWCAPAPIFVASAWGQIDGVSSALAIGALGLALSRRFSWAFIVLTICALVKPQFGMLGLPLIIGWWRHDNTKGFHWLWRVGVTAVLCILSLIHI